MAIWVKKRRLNGNKAWTDDEIRMLRRNEVPDGRTLSQCRGKAYQLGVKFVSPNSNRWTEEQIASARDGQVPEGKTESAMRAYCAQHKIPLRKGGGLNEREFTEDEAKMVLDNVVPPGRTVCECRAYSIRTFGRGFRPTRRAAMERAVGLYNMHNADGLSYTDIARRIGISRQRVQQLCRKASNWLKEREQ